MPAAAPTSTPPCGPRLAQIQDAKRPTYIVFLTDGLPTAGETNEMKIVANAKELNKLHARVFAFGVGYDVNSRLLDKLVRENFGQSEYVRPNEDIEDRVSKLYNRIESPVLTGVQLEFVFDEMRTEEGKPVNRVYPKDSFDLFAGEQLVVVGRYRKPGAAKVVVQGKVGEAEQKFDFPATLVEKSNDDELRLHRETLGCPPRRRNSRRTGPQGQERRTGQGTGRSGHPARHPHAVHVVHGRRKHEHPRFCRQCGPRRRAADGTWAMRRGTGGVAQRAMKGCVSKRPAGAGPAASSMEAFEQGYWCAVLGHLARRRNIGT